MTTDIAKPKSRLAAIFSVVAISAGTYAFVLAGIKGHANGWELLLPITATSLVAGLIAIARERRALTYVAGVFAVLGVFGLLMGA
jgi:hypothetical protein